MITRLNRYTVTVTYFRSLHEGAHKDMSVGMLLGFYAEGEQKFDVVTKGAVEEASNLARRVAVEKEDRHYLRKWFDVKFLTVKSVELKDTVLADTVQVVA